MTSLEKYKAYGEELEKLLLLRTSPIGVKMLETEEDIPEEAIRPKRDRKEHLAQCQAFSMSRRHMVTVAMLKEDNWCWAPLIGFGLVEPPDLFLEGKTGYPFMVSDLAAAKKLAKETPCLEYGRYIGIVSGPLRNASFKPDLILIYSNTSQLRTMLLSVKYMDGCLVSSQFDPLDSCIYSTVPVITNGQYRITLPDPGEYERALAGEDETIFSFPESKLERLLQGLRHFEEGGLGYKNFTQVMRPDFNQPEFYKKLFHLWGLNKDA